MVAAKLLLATAVAVSLEAVQGFAVSPGSCLFGSRGTGLRNAALALSKPQRHELAMSCGNEPPMSRRDAAAAILLTLSAPAVSWAEEEEKKPTRTAKIRKELLKEAEEMEEHMKGKPVPPFTKGLELRQKLMEETEEAEREMKVAAAEHKHMSMRELREFQEDYLRNFEHESEDVAMAVEIAQNEHPNDKIVEPLFIFSPFLFLWYGFKLFNRKWNLGK